MQGMQTLLMLGMLVFWPAVEAADEAAAPTPAAVVEDEAARQFRIYREALLQGSTEEVRVDAAVGLLLNKDNASRDLLISVITASDNPPAVKAVCKALIKSRVVGTTIGSRDMFLEPLLGLLSVSDAETARLAADALLVFRFDDISERLDTLSHDTTADKRVRYNAVYALQIRPEPQALRVLIKLMDEPDSDVARAAETALQEVFGIPVGTSRQVWEQILDDLKQKSPDDIRRERLLRQEMKLREVQAERDRWQKLYLAALDKQYEMGDEAGRNALILDRLDSELSPVRLWALDKIDRYPTTGQAALRDKLLALLGDESRLVRLKTAKVLNNMSALNPAERLLERFLVEKDPDVALAMFEALGEACFFAFSPGSKIQLPPTVKLQTLEIAGGYLNKDDIETAKKGAEIVRKILELNGLEPEQAVSYLEMLAKRYEISRQRNSALRAELLGMMARLCGQGAQRERAGKMYQPYFVQDIQASDNPPVRLAAAMGLSNLDKALALKHYKQNSVIQDASPALRQLVFDAATVAGQPEDLEWLAAYLGGNGQSESAIAAFRAICQRSGANVALDWGKRLDTGGTMTAFVRELLELAEQKGSVDKNEVLLSEVQARLADWYVRAGQPEGLSAYLNKVKAAGGSLVLPDEVGAGVVASAAYAGLFDLATEIVGLRMERGSLNGQSLILVKLDEYFQSAKVANDIKADFLQKLAAVKATVANPVWDEKLQHWFRLISAASGQAGGSAEVNQDK